MADPNRIPSAMRDRAQAIIDITDSACHEHLDDECGQIACRLVARLARKRPPPLLRGDGRIWAAGVIYAAGQINFLSDPTQTPHLTEGVGGALRSPADHDGNKAALLVDARMLPPEVQAEAVRLGLSPDLDRLRTAA